MKGITPENLQVVVLINDVLLNLLHVWIFATNLGMLTYCCNEPDQIQANWVYIVLTVTL